MLKYIRSFRLHLQRPPDDILCPLIQASLNVLKDMNKEVVIMLFVLIILLLKTLFTELTIKIETEKQNIIFKLAFQMQTNAQTERFCIAKIYNLCYYKYAATQYFTKRQYARGIVYPFHNVFS